MEANTYMQCHDVVVDSTNNKTQFEFPVKTDIDTLYGVLLSPSDKDLAKGSTFGLSVGNQVVVHDNSAGIECSLFMNDGEKPQSNYVPVAISNVSGQKVSGFIEGGEAFKKSAATKTFVMKIYLLGKVKQ